MHYATLYLSFVCTMQHFLPALFTLCNSFYPLYMHYATLSTSFCMYYETLSVSIVCTMQHFLSALFAVCNTFCQRCMHYATLSASFVCTMRHFISTLNALFLNAQICTFCQLCMHYGFMEQFISAVYAYFNCVCILS